MTLIISSSNVLKVLSLCQHVRQSQDIVLFHNSSYHTPGFQEGGTPGRHEPPLWRHEPPSFARQTEPQLCRPSLRCADRASAMQ